MIEVITLKPGVVIVGRLGKNLKVNSQGVAINEEW